jgi:hypothetical protein
MTDEQRTLDLIQPGSGTRDEEMMDRDEVWFDTTPLLEMEHHQGHQSCGANGIVHGKFCVFFLFWFDRP